MSGGFVTATYEQRDGTFWVATTDGLDILDRRTGKVTQHFPLPPHPPLSLQIETVMDLLEDHANVLWVTYSFGNGLARVDRRNGRLIEYSPGGAASDGQQFSGIRAIQEDEDGTLWLGTASGGILKLDRDRQHFVRSRNDPRHSHSLGSDQIVALFADRDRNIWVGTTGGGLDRFTYRQIPFHTYRHEPYNPNSLESNYTSSVLQDSHGDLWVGSREALTRIDGKTGKYTFYRSAGEPGGLSNTWVVSMAEDRAGYLWFGTLGGGLNRYDRRSGRFKVFRHNPADPHSLSHDNVLGLYVDHKGTLWAGTEDGLSAFDAATGRFRIYRPQKPGWYRRYRAIAEDAHGALWLGSLGGDLQRLDPTTGKFTIFLQGSGGVGEQVNAVCVDRSGTVWAGTQSGLDRLDPATGKLTEYFERDGLPGNSVNSILENQNGDLWLSTSNGLSRFSPATHTFSNYYTSDGLLGNEFYNYANAYKSPTGELFFNSYAGVVGFFPEEVEKVADPYIPPVVLTDLQLFNKPVSIGAKSPLKQSISYTNSLVLSHGQNIFSFEFAALSYFDPEQIRYRYRLEGLETGWNEVNSLHRSATYTTLPPGRYVFRVQAHTNRGVLERERGERSHPSPAPVVAYVVVRFQLRGLDFVVPLGALQASHVSVCSAIQHTHGRAHAHRTRTARHFVAEFSRVDAALSKCAQPASERPVEAVRALDDALVRADQAIIEGRDAVHDLRSSTIENNDLAQAITALGEELATYDGARNSATFRVLVEGTPHSLDPILRDEIYRVVREALRNAFHYAQARRIEAEITYGDTLFRMRVRDDGNGIDPEVLDQGSRAGHWGLPGMHERAKRIGGELNVWSRPGAGTEVELTIPCSIAYGRSPVRARFRLTRRKKAVHS